MSLSPSRITKASLSLSWKPSWTLTTLITLLLKNLMLPRNKLIKFSQARITKKDSQGMALRKGLCLEAIKRRQNNRIELEGARKIKGRGLLWLPSKRMSKLSREKDTAKFLNISRNSTKRKLISNIKKR